MIDKAHRGPYTGITHAITVEAMQDGMQEMISVRSLTVSFPSPGGKKRTVAVDNIDLSLEAGSSTGIIGESGSGKSVTCYSLTGLVGDLGGRVDSGSVTAFGVDMLHSDRAAVESVRRTKCAYVFQEPVPALTPHTTIAGHFALRFSSMGIKRASEIRRRTEEILLEVQLPPSRRILRSFPRELSGGMAQRVMIGLALAGQPELLIADEPTTSLDVTTRMRIMETVAAAANRHTMGLLLVSHDVGLVAAMTRDVLVMNGGRIVERGAAAQVISYPRHSYTQSLISSVPVLSTRTFPRKSQETKPILELSSVTVEYPNGVRALDGVSLTFRTHESIGIVGESGSGKSTLVKTCLGLLPVTAGEVLVDGLDTSRMDAVQLREAKRRMQIIFQNPAGSFNPNIRMQRNLQEPLKELTSLSETQRMEVIHSLLAQVGLHKDVCKRYPRHFSGGQKQRLSITRSISVSPMILFADEAVSSLDVSIQAGVISLLNMIQQSLGFTLVFVTHDLAAASQLCERIIVMRQGMVVEEGPAAQVLTAPHHAYTRELLQAASWTDIAKLKKEGVYP